jgi:hypothetical protein
MSTFYVYWLASLSGYVGSMVTIKAGNRIDPTSQPGPLKSFNDVTSAFTSLLGVCGLVAGAAACSQEGAPPLIWASAITNPLPNTTAFVFPIIKRLPTPQAQNIVTWIKVAFDGIAGVTSVITNMVANGLALRGIDNSSSKLPDTGAKVGVEYTYDYKVTTSYPPVTWTLQTTPDAPRLTVVTGQDKQTGQVSGVPAATGDYIVTAAVAGTSLNAQFTLRNQ